MKDDGEHLDIRALNELKQIMGDEFSLLVDTFSNDSVLRIEAIKEAVVAQDPESIRRTAHSFKGSASNMGAPHLTELCRVLEEQGLHEQLDGTQSLLDQIVAEYASVAKALEGF